MFLCLIYKLRKRNYDPSLYFATAIVNLSYATDNLYTLYYKLYDNVDK